jgi:hypothetical protein
MIGGGGFVFLMGSFGYKKLSKWYGTQGTRKFLLGQRKKERKKCGGVRVCFHIGHLPTTL